MDDEGQRTPLERSIDDAIRSGLREAGAKGMLSREVAHILPLVMEALRAHEPSVEEVVAEIKKDGGFLRAGDHMVLSDGRHAGSRVLTNALLRLWREEQEK